MKPPSRCIVGTAAMVAASFGGLTTCSRSPRSTRAASASHATSTVLPPATATTTPPPFSFRPSVDPPQLNNKGSDYGQIVSSLLAYSDWLYARNPDVALVSRICAPGSQSEEAHLNDLRELAKQHRRAYELLRGPASVTVLSTHRDEVVIRSDQHIFEQDLVDPSGAIVDRKAFGSTTSYLVVITKEADGKWYLVSVNQVASEKSR